MYFFISYINRGLFTCPTCTKNQPYSDGLQLRSLRQAYDPTLCVGNRLRSHPREPVFLRGAVAPGSAIQHDR